MTQPINFSVADGIGHLELNRPKAANTVNMALAHGLHEAAIAAANNDDVRVIFLTGAGKRFCGGGDIGAITSADDPGAFITELASTADAGVQVLEALDRPVVAAVHGAVAGAGLGIMLAADVIIAAPDTKFVFAYPSVGLTPDCGVSVSLPRAMGLQRALAFALSEAPMSAEAALQQGLITEISEDPQARAREIATSWAGKSSAALGATRQLLRQSNDTARDAHGEREATTIGTRVDSSEAQQLINAFVSR